MRAGNPRAGVAELRPELPGTGPGTPRLDGTFDGSTDGLPKVRRKAGCLVIRIPFWTKQGGGSEDTATLNLVCLDCPAKHT